MSIEAIMTSPVISICMDDPIRLVGEYFENRSINHLPVVDEKKKVLGVVSDREYLSVVSPYYNTPSETRRDLELMARKVHTIMRRDPLTLSPQASLSQAARLILDNEYSSLLVTADASNTLLGIVTWKDLVRSIAEVNIDIAEGQVEIIPYEEEPALEGG
ncbi:MAG: CBS domain-containing protein [bacterium]